MKKIILHWSAGGPFPCGIDLEHYHYMFDTQGNLHKGKHKPSDNLDCKDGNYAAHTGGGNTSSIGVALCGMNQFVSPEKSYRFPITKKQLEACLCFCAGLCLKYNIATDSKGVMTHYEFGVKNPHTTSSGKIDITYLPPYSHVKSSDVGDFLRQKIRWYISRLEEDAKKV